MLKEERLQIILKMLETNQRVTSLELSQILNVSDDTIRRDLNELDQNGLLLKVHGGAIPKSSTPYKLKERVNFAHEEKVILAQKSLEFFKDGQVIILDNGSTNMEVAKVIPLDMKLTIFTNSIPVAQILSEHPNVELFLLGGKVFKDAQTTYGHDVIEVLGQIRADLCLLGICSIHPEIGLTIPDYEECQSKRKMVEVSQKVIALVTADKIGTAENFVVCKYKDLDIMLTDGVLYETLPAEYRGKGVEIK